VAVYNDVPRRFMEAVAPGSYLALSRITDEAVSPEGSQAAQAVYQGASAPVVPRTLGLRDHPSAGRPPSTLPVSSQADPEREC